MDISKILGGAGGGGGGNPMAAMGMMAGMGQKMGGLGGLGGAQMPGMGGMGGRQIDPRMQGATMEQAWDPNGPLQYRFGGAGALNPVQQAMLEQRQGQAPMPGAVPNMNALAPFFMSSGGQPGALRGPLRGM